MTDGNGEVSELPQGWKWTQLGNLGNIVAGGTPSTKIEEYWGNEISWVSPADLSGYTNKFISRGRKFLSKLGLENSSAQVMPAGSVLFSSRAPIGYVVISANEICTNQGFKSLVPSKEIYNEYVYYYLKASKALAEEYASGTTFKEISGKSFSILPIPLPPHNEQKRIVEKIEELFSDLDQGIESLKTAQKQLKVYRQAVLKWAFEGKLTEKWRRDRFLYLKTGEALLAQIKTERENHYQQQLAEWEAAVKEWEAKGKVGKKPSKPQKLKELPTLTKSELSELPPLPKNWCWVRVGNLTHKVTVGHVGSMKGEYIQEGIPFLRSQNVRENRFDSEGLKYVSRQFHEFLSKSQLNLGDVVIVRSGNVGTACVIPDTLKEANCSDLVIIKRPFLTNSKIVSYYFNSVTKTRVNEKKVGVALTHFNTQSIEEFTIPFTTFEEQEKIVQEIELRLSICDQLEATIIENLQKAEALRQSILKQAFEGKLVAQDPNDEPAEKLLERIKQEKINQKAELKQKSITQLKIEGIPS